MPRIAKPWYRRARAMWYATIAGKQIPLQISDEHAKEAAEQSYRELVDRVAAAAAIAVRADLGGTGSPYPPRPPIAVQTVDQAVLEFLTAAERKLGKKKLVPGTLVNYRLILGQFAGVFGSEAMSRFEGDGGAELVEDWADRPEWSDSTRNSYLGTIQILFKYHKLRVKIARPAKQSRGSDTCLTDEQFTLVLAAVNRQSTATGDLTQLLRALRETGARPAEIARLAVDQVDWANQCTRLSEHKNKRHGHERVIYFSSSAMAVLCAQRERYPSGLLFRTRSGGGYSPGAIVRRCGQISERVGFRVIAYGLGRHSFATRALLAGTPDVVVAQLLGHRGTAMLHRHYSHLGEHGRTLREAVERVSSQSQ